MTNVFEGQPDTRQSANIAEPLSRFRPRYRALTEEEKVFHDNLKLAYENVERCMEVLAPGRYKSLALTALEESCMWAVKQLTAERPAGA